MALNLSPIAVLQGWGNRLMSPLGIIFILCTAVYIYLRVSGHIEGLGGYFDGSNKGGSSGGSRPPDYVIK